MENRGFNKKRKGEQGLRYARDIVAWANLM